METMMAHTVESPWEPQPAATEWFRSAVSAFHDLHPQFSSFQSLLREETGTRLIDWVDHLILNDIAGIEDAGFVGSDDGWYTHPGALLPPIRKGERNRLAMRVDSVSDFALANASRFAVQLSGSPGDLLRTGWIDAAHADADFGVIEHRGGNVRQMPPQSSSADKAVHAEIREQFRLRCRKFDNRETAQRSIQSLVASAISRIGPDLTCDLFFEAERGYWQSRNRAGRIQYMRQQALGLGWGNHDHHTYRSSRENFASLIGLLEQMGFVCRERFYAGREAGWGAQVIEHPVCGVVIFADVDLSPDEITGDFAHEPLPSRSQLGTIGLWCTLHGEALFEAGMHHLECQFDFDGARTQLQELGVSSMKPFTDFPFLRQCFTEGERWTVDSGRIDAAHKAGLISADQASRFASEGAVGSHLEILERNDGYRGFNQTGINEIIRDTDPRRWNQPATAGT
jgi:hypothetical protein